MILKDFITNYVDHNAMVRLWKDVQGGHSALYHTNYVEMAHEIISGEGQMSIFLDYPVKHIVCILVRGPYSEAINIVIKF